MSVELDQTVLVGVLINLEAKSQKAYTKLIEILNEIAPGKIILDFVTETLDLLTQYDNEINVEYWRNQLIIIESIMP